MGYKEIRMNGLVIGQATVTIEGLYAVFKCVCHFSNRKIYAIFLKNENGDRLLGTCVPQNKAFVLETKIPKKEIQNCDFKLYAAAKHERVATDAMYLVPGEPINEIQKLDRMRFQVRSGKKCLLIIEENQENDNKLCEVNSMYS